MSTAPHLVIAAGGTGGHMFPAQALAEAMLKEGWRVTLSTDARGAKYTSGFPNEVSIREVPSATFARGGLLSKAIAPFRILWGIGMAKLRFLSDRPTVVAGFGGYPSIPALSAAWALRVPRIIHEQNGVLGRVNQIFAKHVNKVACGTWPTKLPKGVEGIRCGNPVRHTVMAQANAPMPNDENGTHILVMGGSQGARILSEIVPDALGNLPTALKASFTVTHQARPEDADRVAQTYEVAGVDADVRPFFDDVPDRMAKSRLIISRAGASSVAEIGVIGRPSILIPFAAATGDHQTANAQGLVTAGGAVMIPESALDPASLSEHIHDILTTPGKAEEMRRGALDHGLPDATQRLVELITQLKPARMP